MLLGCTVEHWKISANQIFCKRFLMDHPQINAESTLLDVDDILEKVFD